MSAAEHLNPQQFYLRSGDLPRGGRSRNYATGELEHGVSVYDMTDHNAPKTPPEGEWADDDLRDRLKSDEPWHVVTGKEAGVGGDGEPVIRDPKIVGRWHPSMRVVHR